MRLSISSFNWLSVLRRLWFLLIFFITLFLLLSVYSSYWLKQGYVPAIVDSKSLWAQQRDKVYNRNKTPLVFIGASRTLFGIDMPYMRERLPEFEPVMLALNGLYPLATLQDLALDKQFSGVVVVDIDSHGLNSVQNGMQIDYVNYYQASWNYSWRVHRYFLNKWQQFSVLGNPAVNGVELLKRHLMKQDIPRQATFTTDIDRNSGLLLTDADGEQLKKVFVKLLRDDLEDKYTADVKQWASNLGNLKHWIGLIQARGGQVIFYTPPVSGELQKLYDSFYPKERYWDVLMLQLPVKALQASEIEQMHTIVLPDGSHMNKANKRAYSALLIDALLERKML